MASAGVPFSEQEAVTFEEIEAARARIAQSIMYTPCRASPRLSARSGAKVHLKLENLQETGSFKERGACNKLLSLSPKERAAGVIAASAGNHAQALALHGARLGIAVKIVMPEGTPLVKVSRTKGYGAEVVLYGANYDEAYARAVEIGLSEGRTFAHPFDDRAVIAGQGTIGLELLEQNPYLDAVLVAIGGGGLISGVACAIKETNPKIKVIGIEPVSLASMKRALDVGEPIEVAHATTLADGIAVRKVGALTLAGVRRYVDEIVTVTEEQIASAILTLLEDEKTVAEGAGAAPVAALFDGIVPALAGKRVCPIVCGGNIDVNVLARIIERGLVSAGRLWCVDVVIQDTPGSLAALLAHLAAMRANVLEIMHNRVFASGLALNTTQVQLRLETRGREHIEAIHISLRERGFEVR